MTPQLPAFAGSAFAPFALGGRLPATTPRNVSRHARISMTDSKTKKKKVAPVMFATDIKGKPVWKLRSAVQEDVDALSTLIPILPTEIISTFVEDSEGGSLVCEGTIKGTKEGEGYKSRLFGIALVDVDNELLDSAKGAEGGFTEAAELITVKVHPDMPDTDVVKQQLTLGAMKKLKTKGISRMRVLARKDDDRYIKELKQLGFSGSKPVAHDNVMLSANLSMLSPDPQKKIE